MLEQTRIEAAVAQFSDWRWRIDNLYYITDKSGAHTKFQMNGAQAQLWDEMSWMNVILKARQRGFSTFIQIFLLDAALFNSNIRAGVIAHNLEDARIIFRDKVKYAYDNLPESLKMAVPTVSDTSMELLLGNNSSIRVGTSLRSGTLQYLHISEYGKICAKYPEKAREIRTGALNTLQAGAVAFVESTAEGQDGHFYEICQEAETKQRRGDRLTPLDFKFHFFPWWDADEYEIDPDGVTVNAEMAAYFDGLEQEGVPPLNDAKRAWYVKKLETQKDDMKREYPSTPKEAFEAAVEGAYYGKHMARLEAQGHVGHFPHQPEYPVHTAWDIGYGDSTAIWFFQCLPGPEIRNIYYYENAGEYLQHYAEKIKDLALENGWTLGKSYVPHDIRVHEWASGKIRVERMIQEKLRPEIVPRIGLEDGIDAVRHHLPICRFDLAGTEQGVRCLKLYRKEWDEERGTWKPNPRKDWAIHGADAFRYEIAAYKEFRPTEVLPDYPKGPDGKPYVPMKPPKVLAEMSHAEVDSVINDRYSRMRNGTR